MLEEKEKQTHEMEVQIEKLETLWGINKKQQQEGAKQKVPI